MRRILVYGVEFLIVAMFCLACSSRQKDRIVLRDVPETRKTTPAATPSASLPKCPAGGIAPIQPSQPDTGHHKVRLSWKASPGGQAVGYCLYRSTKKDAPKQNPTCAQCEQINVNPVPDLACVDDLVEDNTTYYYVVTAINSAGKISPASNQFPVPIPAANKINPAPKGQPPRACRVSSPTPK